VQGYPGKNLNINIANTNNIVITWQILPFATAAKQEK
jgi:hypothetical protein